MTPIIFITYLKKHARLIQCADDCIDLYNKLIKRFPKLTKRDKQKIRKALQNTYAEWLTELEVKWKDRLLDHIFGLKWLPLKCIRKENNQKLKKFPLSKLEELTDYYHTQVKPKLHPHEYKELNKIVGDLYRWKKLNPKVIPFYREVKWDCFMLRYHIPKNKWIDYFLDDEEDVYDLHDALFNSDPTTFTFYQLWVISQDEQYDMYFGKHKNRKYKKLRKPRNKHHQIKQIPVNHAEWLYRNSLTQKIFGEI